jgi:hypothetical protein
MREDKVALGAFAVLGLLMIALVVAACQDNQYYKRLMSECMADGHKEYECRSMLRD